MPPPCEPLNARIQELLQNLGIVVIKKGNSCVDGLRLASVDFFIEALGVDYMSVIVWGVQRQIGKVVDEAENDDDLQDHQAQSILPLGNLGLMSRRLHYLLPRAHAPKVPR